MNIDIISYIIVLLFSVVISKPKIVGLYTLMYIHTYILVKPSNRFSVILVQNDLKGTQRKFIAALTTHDLPSIIDH